MSAATSRSLTSAALELNRSAARRSVRSSLAKTQSQFNENMIHPSSKMHSKQTSRKNVMVSSIDRRVEIHHYDHDLFSSSLEGTLSRLQTMQQLGRSDITNGTELHNSSAYNLNTDTFSNSGLCECGRRDLS